MAVTIILEVNITKKGQDYIKMGLDQRKLKIFITCIKSNVNAPLILSYYFNTSLFKYLHALCYGQEYWKRRKHNCN